MTITLPQFYHTFEVVSALAQLKHLQSVRTNVDSQQKYEERGTRFRSQGAGFNALRELHFDMDVKLASITLETTPALSKLTTLWLSWRHLSSWEAFGSFANAIGTSCPALQSLGLNLFPKDQTSHFFLHFNDLRPLFRCRRIISFSLTHHTPLTLEPGDVQELATAWPKIEGLNLCSDPCPRTGRAYSGTLMQVLKDLAEHCGQLKELSLYFNGTNPPRFSPELVCGIRFKHLRTLGVGTSQVPGGDLGEVACFLASLCELEVTLKHGVSEWYLGTPPDLEDTARPWEAVASMTVKVSIINALARRREAALLATIASLQE